MRKRGTIARHARLRSPSAGGQLLTFLAVAVAVVVVAAGGVVGFAAYGLASEFATNAVALGDDADVPPSIGEYEGPFDVLIVGTDECEEELKAAMGERCEGPDAGGELNDVNMLVHVADDPRRVTVVSFPRDLQIPIPSCTREDGTTTTPMSGQPINSAYSVGGLGCVAKTISVLSQQTIPFAAKVSFGNVVNITDAIGGVQVCIGNDGIRDPNTGIDWPAGPRTVQGLDALQFLRTRYGVGDQSDLARIGNQQQYMSRLIHKIRSDEVLADPAALLKLATAAVDNITPSESLASPLRIVQLALAVKSVPFEDITFVQYPVLDDPADADKVIPDDEAAAALWDALEQNRPLQLSGEAGSNGGVIEVTPTTPPPATTPAPDGATPAPTASPGEEAIVLPENVNGSNAEQETCSAGNR